MSNKFDDKHIRKVNLIQLNIDDLKELMQAKYEVELEDMKHCSNCGHIFNVNEIWYEDNHNCPYCNSVENIFDCYQDDIDELNVKDLQDDIGDDGVNEIMKILKKEEGVSVMEENKINLQEATVKALYDGLKDNTEIDDVEGLVDDVLVVTDPEITTDEYNEVIERAGEIIEDTPEGEIPLDPTYLGEYLQICPICGGSFIEDHILEPGTACPICYETPESFVMVGKLQAEEEVAEDNGLVDDEVNNDETGEEFTPTPLDELGAEDNEEGEEGEEVVEPETEPEGELPNEEPVEREERPRGARTRRNREVASKEIPQGNILTEKLEEKKESVEEKPVKVLCYRQVTEYPTRQEAIDEFKSGMMCSEGSERERYTNIYLSLINTDKDFVYDDVDDYNDYIVKHSKNEDVDSDKKDDGKELLLGAEEDDKDFTIEKIDNDKIKELADKSALTWEGAVITDEALQKIVDDFKDKTDINLPVKFYTYTGRQMNDMYGLTEKNAYKDDLHFLSVDLDNWNNIDNLPMFKMKAKARWLDDIVDGNADAQKIIDNK